VLESDSSLTIAWHRLRAPAPVTAASSPVLVQLTTPRGGVASRYAALPTSPPVLAAEQRANPFASPSHRLHVMSRLAAVLALSGLCIASSQRVAVEVFATPNCAATPIFTSDYTAGTCGAVQMRSDTGVVFRCDESGASGSARICDTACTVCADPIAFANDQVRGRERALARATSCATPFPSSPGCSAWRACLVWSP